MSWVSRGCRGRFAATGYRDSRQGYNNGGYDDRYDFRNGYGSGRELRCESRDGRYNFCASQGYGGRAQLRRQLGDSSCRLDVSWGYRNGGVWVDRGCRAEFVIY